MICVSCNNEHNDKYCPNCGEKNGIKKITLASIIEDTFSSVTNMDRGFLYNIKALILKPQKLITDYILGKRRGILNPISLPTPGSSCTVIFDKSVATVSSMLLHKP